MPFNHDAFDALPASGIVRNLLRALLYKDVPYVLADTDNPQDLVGVDPETGAAIIDILYRGRLFHYDETDSDTPHDGVTTLVIQGGRRYKLDVLRTPVSVLDKDLIEPPASPSVGDQYLLVEAPAGLWNTFSVGDIVYLSGRGWERIIAPVGANIYVRDERGYYHRNDDGDWVAGFGSTPLSTGSVPLSAAINFGARVIVENATTNLAPVSPSVGEAYICGPSSVAPFVANKIAICEVDGSFTIYQPSIGWEAYDKSKNTSYTFNGTAWVSSAGSWVAITGPFLTPAAYTTFSGVGPTNFGYSNTVPPKNTEYGTFDPVTITHAAKRAGATLRLSYRAMTVWSHQSTGRTDYTMSTAPLAVFRDGEKNAIAWCEINRVQGDGSSENPSKINEWFTFTAVDTNPHVYKVAVLAGVVDGGGGSIDLYLYASLLSRRQIMLEESA